MLAILLAALLPFADAQQPKLTPQQQKLIERAKASYEVHRQAAVRLNDMAQSIHSEEDARKLVDGVEEELFGHRGPIQSKLRSWITRSMRRRVAHAEFAAVSDPDGLIPEQRVVDVWNEYIREIGAPEDALVTVAEVHNLRDGMYTITQRIWSRGFGQSLWMIPGVYALDNDGRVANGCRALEALKILYDMENRFVSVKDARERVLKGVLLSELIKRPQPDRDQPPKTIVQVLQSAPVNLISSCARRYSQEHGQKAFDQLMDRLFQELFPG